MVEHPKADQTLHHHPPRHTLPARRAGSNPGTGRSRTIHRQINTLGTARFEIADTEGWTLDVQMPQRVAEELAAGKVGIFAPNAKPEEQLDLQLTRIQPLAQPADGKTVYIAEAELGESTPWIKPGMEGIARIEFGDRPVWWVSSHRLINYFRTNFWL